MRLPLKPRVSSAPADDGSLVADIAEHMLLALAAAHAAAMVHRDIKPQNIMVMTDERQRFARWLLADFGLAKSFASMSTGLTRSGEMIGSWSYAAPRAGEPHRGEPSSGGPVLPRSSAVRGR